MTDLRAHTDRADALGVSSRTPPVAGGTPARWGVFPRLAVGMALLGLAMGAVFPLFAELLGVPARYAGAPSFRTACLAAGLVLGGANWLLVRVLIGRRLRVLAGRLTTVARIVGDPVTGDGPRTALDLPVESADDLGATAAAFNSLLTALERERRFRSVVHATSDVMALLNPAGEIAFVSDSITDVLGWAREDVLGQRVRDLLHAEDGDLFTPAGAPITRDQARDQVFVVQVRHRDGGWRHLEISSSDRRDDPVIGGVLLTARDVTERLELQRRLSFQATHDDLTGLPNRAAVLDRADALLSDPRGGGRLAVVFLDLDGFKEVNDTLGHGHGDQLLAQVGPRLRPLVRDTDLVGRLGGDEFAVLMPGVSAAEAVSAATRLRAALQQPFPVEGHELDVDASLGIAVSGPDAADTGTLFRQADIAMYRAKAGRTGVALFDA
ncbi:sensor domain-containing diguanylate cyclase [Modestobacter roseus]|uniref:PAS domain S-box-containing protein/diguanylate cyclase (GGDEF)-like protein n=1 Tax=Modestobacter roseus TaxID=1181884 RepID=A0A562IXK6_9ACTN|nr:sensor domain-containing diguanylate cyclase [Modestobacter roseus]MQA32705.1 diguanylate cyclase [Modestobacter roseus]TWH75697.1 PAS domain S-box-containing protein/diguanylate cyclase (GGDEF)-like protein [Modestobacter roseus]